MSLIDVLKFYSSQGWLTFPIQQGGKLPLFPSAHPEGDPLHRICKGECGKVGHGLYDATSDIAITSKWLEQNHGMNIAIVTGKRSGLFVLDVDAGHGGLESLAELEATYGQLPRTPTAQTGGGGRHYFFKHPQSVEIRNAQNSGKIGKGIDIRGDGGYVVAAPSVHQNGNKYAWIVKPSECQPADAPDWLLKAILDDKPAPAATVPQKQDNSVIVSGGRNNYLASFAGVMRKRGASYDAIRSALIAENKNKCVPMLPEAEVIKIADSVARYMPAVAFEDNKDRLQVEWSFCKSIYEFPTNIPDFLKIAPSMFAEKSLGDYWLLILKGEQPIDAAAHVGIVSELEAYKDFDFTRLDGYARAIEKFSILAQYSKHGNILQIAAREGDPARIEQTVQEINKIPSVIRSRDYTLFDAAEDVNKYALEREANPSDVWGIPYAWNKISVHTGGKQKSELILFAGEPKKGKSWWCLQDALQTALNGTPVFYWSGEMPKKQIMTRLEALLGVNVEAMRKGKMTNQEWGEHNDAQALILNSPIFVDDSAGLKLHEIRPMLSRLKAEHGVEQFVIDYAAKVKAPGKDEIEKSAAVTDELSDICIKLDLAGILIASVNKQGMDDRNGAMKSNVRGSGQQLHDAHVIYQFTSFPENAGLDYGVMPQDYYRCAALNISAGREFSQHIEGNFIPYMREANSPRWVELEKRR